MTKRERFILRLALAYLKANLDEVNDSCRYSQNDTIVNGEVGRRVDKHEVEYLYQKTQSTPA